MNAVDSSVVVAGCASWHESHEVARRALDDRPRLVGHCAVEAYSVLTRLPVPHRVPAALVVEFLEDRFPEAPIVLSAAEHRGLLRRLDAAGVAGGAIYDGLVAITALEHGATLLTLDRRAEATYRRCGVRFRLLT
jgi:hypothetical protein